MRSSRRTLIVSKKEVSASRLKTMCGKMTGCFSLPWWVWPDERPTKQRTGCRVVTAENAFGDAENQKAAYKETAGQESGAMVVYDTHQLSQTSSPHPHPLGCCHSWRGWFLLFLDRTQRLAPFTRSKTQAVSNGFLLKNLWGLEKRPCNNGSHNLFNFMKGTFTIYCEAVFMQGPNSECYACWNAKLLFFFMVQKTLGKCELGHDPFFWMFVGTKYGA